MIGEREHTIAAALTQEQVAALIVAIEQFSDLLADSRGVDGLHLNGDVADWGWLEEEWLSAFATAYAPINRLHEARIAELERRKSEAWSRLQDPRVSA